MCLNLAPSTARAAQRIRAALLEDLDVIAATQKPQPTLVEAAKVAFPEAAKVTDEASIVPSRYRTLTSDGRPSHLTVEGILAPSFSAWSSS